MIYCSQEEEMHKSIIEVGESSNGTREVSCKCLYQSSKVRIYLQFLSYNHDIYMHVDPRDITV